MSPSFCRLAAVALLLTIAPRLLPAQSLRGSPSSVNRMYHEARAEDFSFFETSASVRRAASAGILVRLSPDDDLELSDIGYPYVRPATLTFVHRMGAQYHEACGERLVVTSAVRPATRQPPNSTALSVHPTGMAVDLRRPQDDDCRSWLRNTLLDLEERGLVEATEEHSPAHFHVAVFSTPYARFVASRVRSEADETYVVRTGDTLSEIARAHDVTVKALFQANALDDDIIQPGQELKIPNGN